MGQPEEEVEGTGDGKRKVSGESQGNTDARGEGESMAGQ